MSGAIEIDLVFVGGKINFVFVCGSKITGFSVLIEIDLLSVGIESDLVFVCGPRTISF